MPTVRLNELGRGGLVTDVPGFEQGANTLEIAANVICENDAVHAESAIETLADSPVTPRFLISVETPEFLGIVAVSNDRTSVWNGSTWNDITPASNRQAGPSDDQWVSTSFAGIPIWTHLANYPWAWLGYYTGIDVAVPLPWNGTDSWLDREYHARCIRTFRNFLVALHTEEENVTYPRRVRWSASVSDLYALPVWDVLPTNDAGFFDIEEVSKGFIDGMQLRDAFIMYGANEAYALTNIGGNLIMGVQRLPAVKGVLGPNCIVDMGDQHFVVGQSDIYVHNTAQATSVALERVRREFFDNLDRTRTHMVHAAKDPSRKIIAVFYPTEASSGNVCDSALLWNYETNTWTKRSIPSVLFSVTSTIIEPQVVWGDPAPNDLPNQLPYATWEDWEGIWGNLGGYGTEQYLISGLNVSTLIDYTPADVVAAEDFTQPFIERSGVPLNELQAYFHVSTVYPRMTPCDCGTPVNIQIGMQNKPGDTIRWSPVREFNPGVDKKLDVRLAGSLLAYRIWSTEPGNWRFHGLELEVIPGGKD